MYVPPPQPTFGSHVMLEGGAQGLSNGCNANGSGQSTHTRTARVVPATCGSRPLTPFHRKARSRGGAGRLANGSSGERVGSVDWHAYRTGGACHAVHGPCGTLSPRGKSEGVGPNERRGVSRTARVPHGRCTCQLRYTALACDTPSPTRSNVRTSLTAKGRRATPAAYQQHTRTASYRACERVWWFGLALMAATKLTC
jgi:hypothetical protein